MKTKINLRSRRELAQECANLANQTANAGCSFSDGEAFRCLIDEAAAHGEKLAEKKAELLLNVMRERDEWEAEAKLMRQQYEELGKAMTNSAMKVSNLACERDSLQVLVDYAADLSKSIGCLKPKNESYWYNVSAAMNRFNTQLQQRHNSAYSIVAR